MLFKIRGLTNDPLLCVEKIDLVKTIRQQEQQIEKLRQEIDILHKENEQLKHKPNPFEKKGPQKNCGKRSKPPHQWGRKKGHPGSWRAVPDHIDRDEPLTLEACPECRTPLARQSL